MKTIRLIIAFLLACLFAQAQSTFIKSWDQKFGGYHHDELFSMVRYDSNSIFLLGKSDSDSSGNKTFNAKGSFDYWVVRFDENGNKLYDFLFGADLDDFAVDMMVTNDSSLIIGGISDSDSSFDKTENTKGQFDFWVIKSDTYGNKHWDKTFGGNNFNYLRKIIQTKDGGFLLAGVTDSDSSFDVSQNGFGKFDYWIIKIDSAGNKLWDQRYGGSENDILMNAVELYDGSLVLSGASFSDAGGSKTHNNYDATLNTIDYWLIKTDSLGNKLWDKTFGTALNDRFGMILPVEANNLLLCGVTETYPPSFDKTSFNHNPGYDVWMLKLDSAGAILWDRVYGGDGLNEDGITQMLLTNDGSYLIGATSYSQAGYEKSENNLGIEQSWLFKTDTAGNVLMDKTLFTKSHDETCYVLEADHGCLLVANSTAADTGGYVSQNHFSDSNQIISYSDIWVIKLCDTTYGYVTPLSDLASSDTNWCDKLCIDFYDLSQNNPTTWQWYFPGAQPDTSTIQNPTGICYNAYGSFNVMLVACNPAGCDTILKPGFINEFAPPPAPIIFQSNDTLYSSYSYQYQWFEISNPSAILGTDSFFIPQQPGQYYVIAIDTNGCMTPGNIISITNLYQSVAPDVSVAYNPDNFELIIQSDKIINPIHSPVVVDLAGKVCPIEFNEYGSHKIVINTSSLKAGLYHVNMVCSDYKIVWRFVKPV